MQAATGNKRGLKRIVLGCALCLVGTPLVAILTLLPVIESSRSVETMRFLAPGELEFSLTEVKKPIKYYLWNEHSSNFEGKMYRNSEELPDGLQIEVLDGSGESLEFVFDSSTTMSSNGAEKRSIGFVRIEQATQGRILVQSEEEMDERVMSFAPSPFRHLPAVLLSGGLTLLTILIGAVLAIWGFVLYAKRPSQAAFAAVSSADSAVSS